MFTVTLKSKKYSKLQMVDIFSTNWNHIMQKPCFSKNKHTWWCTKYVGINFIFNKIQCLILLMRLTRLRLNVMYVALWTLVNRISYKHLYSYRYILLLLTYPISRQRIHVEPTAPLYIKETQFLTATHFNIMSA